MATKKLQLTLLIALAFPVVAAASEVRGVVSRIDPARKELVLDLRGIGVRGSVVSFVLAPQVQVTIGTNPANLTDIVPGKRVRVSVEMRDGKATVTSIHVVDILGTLQNLQQALPGLQGLPATPAPPTPAAAPPNVPMPTPVADSVAGTLRRVAVTEREIIVASKGEGGREQYIVLPVPADGRISRDGKPVPLDDLKEGEAALVKTERRDGKLSAVSIEVGQAGQAGAKVDSSSSPIVPVGSSSPASSSRIGQLRRALQMIDLLLEQLEKQREGR
jgi:hypothetical protein